MTVYYVIMAIALVVAVVILIGMIVALMHHRAQPLAERLNEARQDLLKKETETGSSELLTGSYSKISNEMLRDIAKTEGFEFIEVTSRAVAFQRPIIQENGLPKTIDEAPMHPRGDLGDKRHRKRLQDRLSEAAPTDASLTVRRDELGALPKAEILRTAQEAGWEYQSEEISGDEWRLLFHRNPHRAEARRNAGT